MSKPPASPPGSSPTTWAALLGAWTDFARSSAAFPKTPEGDALRDAVPAIIGLQAVTFALRDIDRLHPDERPVSLETAALLIRQYASQLHDIWRGEDLHPEIAALIHDARHELAVARGAGVEWTVAADRLLIDHPAELVESLLGTGFDGDLYLPTPGVPLFRGCPCAFARAKGGGLPPEATLRAVQTFFTMDNGPNSITRGRARGLRQAYRQFDFGKGGPVRDLVVPFDTALPAGQPLLMAAILIGEAQPVPMPIRGASGQAQLPVVFDPDSE